MWEQVALHYNASRTRGSPERDVESLRRKFKNLYSKKKPTDSGEVPVRLRPVAMAKAAQMKIEAEGGVHTSHDGLDEGDDDAALRDDEEEGSQDMLGVSRREVARSAPENNAGGDFCGANEGTCHPESPTDGEADEDFLTEPDAQDINTSRSSDDVSQYAQRSPPPTPTTQPLGTILTDQGPIDVSLAGAYQFSGNESSSGDDGITDVSAEDMDQRPVHSSATATTPQQPSRIITPTSATSAQPRLDRGGSHTSSMETSVPTPTARGSGRPRSSRREPIPTFASADGPELRRNPQRAGDETREAALHHRLSVSSNRLGGQDLRVFRDNFEAMTQGMLNTSAKKSPAERSMPDETSSTPSFSKNKRIKARQRLNEIQREIEEAARRQSSAGGYNMGMLLLFQKDSDRRAETEEKRLRQERDERLEAEKRERDERREAEKRERNERERIRSAEAKAALERRQEDAQAARQLREEQRSAELAKEAKLELDREENKRRFEERLAFDREQARQRHEQMMMLLASLKKQ
ncbi:unnamed protein product [Phytophthora fragariaefolia]|uniref:Unnamed protein product n=1 Tax=Phytophthora fragariaefolia TaxID=1490495 RepID=A0A9W6XHU5_9STRA|nr:unnamed protein product [Phytophthora fragariaefolia]